MSATDNTFKSALKTGKDDWNSMEVAKGPNEAAKTQRKDDNEKMKEKKRRCVTQRWEKVAVLKISPSPVEPPQKVPWEKWHKRLDNKAKWDLRSSCKGESPKRSVQRSKENLKERASCSKQDFPVCLTGIGKSKYCYKVHNLTCRGNGSYSVHYGETSCTVYIRLKEHYKRPTETNEKKILSSNQNNSSLHRLIYKVYR